MNRRGFLQSILVAAAAPAFVRIGSLMAPRGLIVPQSSPFLFSEGGLITVRLWLPAQPSRSDPFGQRGFFKDVRVTPEDFKKNYESMPFAGYGKSFAVRLPQ